MQCNKDFEPIPETELSFFPHQHAVSKIGETTGDSEERLQAPSKKEKKWKKKVVVAHLLRVALLRSERRSEGTTRFRFLWIVSNFLNH